MPGDRINALLLEVDINSAGPSLIVSRATPEFVVKLFEREVAEIHDGVVKIMGIAREPGRKYVVYYLSEILSVGGLFALLALLVVAVAHEDDSLRRKALRWEIGATIVLSFALRIFVYWFTAFLDKKLMIDFYFNDKTLAHLVHGGALTSYIFSSLFNLPVLLFVILLSLRLVRANYRASQRGMASGMMKKIPVVVYLAVAVIFAVIETILTINDLGIAASMNVLTTLLMPYIEIALFTLLGSYLLTYLVEWFDQKENA